MLVSEAAQLATQAEGEVLRQAANMDMPAERKAPLEIVAWEPRRGEAPPQCASRRQRTAYLLVGVGLGSVEQFSHFLFDYVLNIHRLRLAAESHGLVQDQPRAPECASSVLLQTESMAELARHRPRKFYDLLGAVTGGGAACWEALDEIPDGTCFDNVVLAFSEFLPQKTPRVNQSQGLCVTIWHVIWN